MHTDIPTPAEIEALAAVGGDACVSAYLPTSPLTPDAEEDRIEFKNLVSEIEGKLGEHPIGRDEREAIGALLAELGEDGEFWAEQAHTLALFATPERIRTFRLANRLVASSSVGARFEITPLLRSTTFPNAAFVLALAQGSVRLLEIAPDLPPHEVRVPDLPTDAASAVGKETIADRAPRRRIQGDEGRKVRLEQYARAVDTALRTVLAGRDLPLILAAAPPLDSIFRRRCSYPDLAERGIEGSPERVPDDELVASAREVLDGIYAAKLVGLRELYGERANEGRATAEISGVSRAATAGAIDTLLVDMDATLVGMIDEAGDLRVEDGGADLIEEIVRRTLAASGRVLAVRSADLPGEGPFAAILRWAA